ncbi:class I SAM-dependent methyltransferase [Kaistia geumhonensis]|uniref:SAM-dependent methyltransferase n=1 Tax=Kaistia geumhonensis TaxID=410839 RepID=A0ABU0MBZ0_9HYPH|nr:class I SAM-dependent methyltransferase [Kaistia geumhonensis]MCX5481411.1 class I SAM-dependent methyltransferase [Kaistia geumhonensis]MDQ0518476.1 SAM-dependent methyltransferase [Kaistia geumhonensis]
MGRFETTAATYERFREPYPAAFFAKVAERLGLAGSERLIDLGTGPGILALGFAPYVGSVLGVDPEAEMIAVARDNAARDGLALPLIHGRTEDLSADLGTFDLVTIGRALHWMERAPTVAVLDRLLAQEGVILTTGSAPAKDDRNPWLETMERVSHSWAPHDERVLSVYRTWFEATPFAEVEDITYVFAAPVTPEHLFARLLTRSSTSPAILGDRIAACRAELLGELAPFFPDGEREETLVARATVIRRR